MYKRNIYKGHTGFFFSYMKNEEIKVQPLLKSKTMTAF